MPGPVSRITAYHYHQAGWRRSAGVCPDRSPSRRKIVTSSRNRRYCGLRVGRPQNLQCLGVSLVNTPDFPVAPDPC